MGALPKNKITSTERGKRRRGNTPTLKRDVKTARVPLHKKGFVAAMLKSLGLSSTAKRSAQSSNA